MNITNRLECLNSLLQLKDDTILLSTRLRRFPSPTYYIGRPPESRLRLVPCRDATLGRISSTKKSPFSKRALLRAYVSLAPPPDSLEFLLAVELLNLCLRADAFHAYFISISKRNVLRLGAVPNHIMVRVTIVKPNRCLTRTHKNGKKKRRSVVHYESPKMNNDIGRI